MRSARRGLAIMGLALIALFMVAACGGSDNESSSTTPSSSGTPEIGVADLTADFSAMAKLKDLAAEGEGMIAVLLPDTTTSARYESSSTAPYLTQAFEAAGLSSDHFKIDNAQGSAEHDADPGRGGHHRRVPACSSSTPSTRAAAPPSRRTPYRKGVQGDRLRPPRRRAAPKDRYYVSFDNVRGGRADRPGRGRLHRRLEGRQPERPGDERRPHRQQRQAQFAEGYNGVLKPHFDDGTYTKVGEPPGTWTPSDRGHDVRAAVTAHPNMNAVVTPNDDNANAVISVLQSRTRSRRRRSRRRARTRRRRVCRTSSRATSAAPSTSRST